MRFLRRLIGKEAAPSADRPAEPPPATWTCPLCGRTSPLDARFCGGCGEEHRIQRDRYDVFISYRREGGRDVATIVKLTLEKYQTVFMDVDEYQTGRFDEKLLRTIEHSTHFVLILSPGCLDRCIQKSDWLKREIVHALQTRRSIVPVMLPGFEFPDAAFFRQLPDVMATLPLYDAIRYSHEQREECLRRLRRGMTAAPRIGADEEPQTVALPPEAPERPATAVQDSPGQPALAPDAVQRPPTVPSVPAPAVAPVPGASTPVQPPGPVPRPQAAAAAPTAALPVSPAAVAGLPAPPTQESVVPQPEVVRGPLGVLPVLPPRLGALTLIGIGGTVVRTESGPPPGAARLGPCRVAARTAERTGVPRHPPAEGSSVPTVSARPGLGAARLEVTCRNLLAAPPFPLPPYLGSARVSRAAQSAGAPPVSAWGALPPQPRLGGVYAQRKALP